MVVKEKPLGITKQIKILYMSIEKQKRGTKTCQAKKRKNEAIFQR